MTTQEQWILDEQEQAIKRGGHEYAKAYIEGLIDGSNVRPTPIEQHANELRGFIDYLFDSITQNDISREEAKELVSDYISDLQTEEAEFRTYSKIPPEHFDEEL